MKKLISKFSLVFFVFIYILPVVAYASDDSQPVKPYDKIIAQSGNWYVEQVKSEKSANLLVGYMGDYESNSVNADFSFTISEKIILKGICLPYSKIIPSGVTIQLTNVAGESYGNMPTEAFPIDGNKTFNPKNQQSYANYVYSSESGIVLPAGTYKLTSSSIEGGVGAFLIKGVSFAADEQYKKSLIEWAKKNANKMAFNFTGTYTINLDAYKTSTLMGKVNDRTSDFSLKDFELVVLHKKGVIELIGKYEGIPFSQECKIIEESNAGIKAEVLFSANMGNGNIGAKAVVFLTKPNDLNAQISINGSATYQRAATASKGADFNTYDVTSSGNMKSKELPMFVTTALGRQGNAGNIPGPDSEGQAAAGILFPPLVGLIVSVVQEMTKPKVRDKAWYRKKYPNLTDEQLAMTMLADAMGNTDEPDEGDAISVGDNEKPDGEDYHHPEGEETAGGEYLENEELNSEEEEYEESDEGEEPLPIPDEPIVGEGPDGETIIQNPDGSVEVTTSTGDTVIRNSDGSTTIKTSEGTVQTFDKDGAVTSTTNTTSDSSGNAKKILGENGETDNSAALLRAADVVSNIYGLSGIKDKADALAKTMKEGLEAATDTLRDAFKSGGNTDDAIQNFLKMNKLAGATDKLRQVANGVNKGFEFAGIGIDTLNNMQELNRVDGSLISGDGMLKALGKSVLVNKLVSAIGDKNPAIIGMEIANTLALGGTEAGDIISPITNIKGAMNALIDGVTDPEKAIDRALAGGYGQNMKNLTDGAMIGKEAIDDPGKFFNELGEVGNDKEFFNGMYESAGSMFRDDKGNIGYVGSAGEAAAQMGVAMAETAAGMAKMTGEISGHIYNKIESFFTW